MFIIFFDVVGRYAFNSPISWVYDIVAIYFLNAILYLMASETLRSGSHLALDLQVRLLPQRVWSLLQGAAWLAVAAVLALACWQIGGAAIRSLIAGEVHPGLYEWPVWLEKGIVAFGLALLVVRIGLRLTRFCLTGADARVFHTEDAHDAGALPPAALGEAAGGGRAR
ncbi:hypothetical protein GCM10010994_19300 [Chelatococcus reniformis]|uniref:TRAP transporter small permease protein n=2 Tax=Chelatococcus reniformis TaxID=1494448 RepID=A0A916U624_9HYPH|nr:hypothetical protein GCM10010994_19300 [Chelatococcus reniformis]